MRTNLEDVAADLAVVDQRLTAQHLRIKELELELAIAKDVHNSLYRLRGGLEGLSELHRHLPELHKESAKHVAQLRDVASAATDGLLCESHP